jgi:ribulose-5-phosphate 4-epimerase/fuculose-1-phosphate aldolase
MKIASASAMAVAAVLATAGCASQSSTPATTTTAVATPDGQQVVTVEQPGKSPRGEVRHTVTGKVSDVERNHGEVTVRTPEGSKLKLHLPPVAVANVREGDSVSLDVTIVPR